MRILLLDTNLASLPLFQNLIDLGFDVFVAGAKRNDTLAILTKNYIEIDYSDINKVQEIYTKNNIDFIIPGCNDISFKTACEFLERNKYILNLDSVETIDKLNVKSQFKQFALNNQIKVPLEYQINDLNFEIKTKFIIKPTDAYSGRGVTIVDKNNISEIENIIDFAIANSKNKNFIIEEFVEGTLYSHSAFIRNGIIYKDFIVEEYCLNNQFAVDHSWVIPEEEFILINSVRAEIQKIIQKLKLCDGLIHTQFICNFKEFWILEVTRRCPGDLYSLLIQKSTGYNYAKEYLKNILQIESAIDNNCQSYNKILRQTLTLPKGGEWISLKIDNNYLELDEFFTIEKSGTILDPAPSGRAGILFLKAKNYKQDFTNLLP
jgi:biotin carboxylase